MKKSKYLIIIKKDDMYLLYNSLYITGIRVYNQKYKNLIDQLEETGNIDYDSNNEFLVDLRKNNMILEDNINEENIINYRFLSKNNEQLGLIMFVTRQCNFACPYCYEEHEALHMTDEILESTKHFIKKLVQRRNYKSVHISWFGGEPTLEIDSICNFMESLKEILPEVNVTGSTTTNAYLLDKEMFLRLYDVGVRGHQITIDGLANTHNKTRIPRSGKGTWDKIMAQLKDISTLSSDYIFNVKLRTNFTKEIIDNAEEWLTYLYNNFGKDLRFKYHFEAVKNLGGSEHNLNIGAKEEADAMDKVFELAREIGIRIDADFAVTRNFSICCYASKMDNFAIDYDGSLMKCTVCIDDDKNKVGKILPDGTFELDENKNAWWTSYTPGQKCLGCEIYPLCYGRKCPNGYDYYSMEKCNEMVRIYKNGIEDLLTMTIGSKS